MRGQQFQLRRLAAIYAGGVLGALARVGNLRKRNLELIELVGPRLVDPWGLAGGADESAGK